MKTKKPKQRRRAARTWLALKPQDHKRPFAEHLYELRSRILHVALAVLLLSTGAYFIQQQLVKLILKPAHGQHFIYTSPGGGIGFLFQLCLDVALVVSLPLIIYEILGFLRPLIKHDNRSFITKCVVASGILAAVGLVFGYVLGLPLALHFLSHQFTTSQITPLLTIGEYMSFVTFYLGGSALLFQLPLVLIIINRIRPLPPRQLLKGERYVIVAALVIAMIMAPTINVIYQLVIAVPIFLAYQIGIVLVWWLNRHTHRPGHVLALMEQDNLMQAERWARPTAPL